MSRPPERIKKAIGSVYSYAADKFYDRVVVHGAFKLFGGDLNGLVLEQGRRAVAAADGAPILDMPVGTAYFTKEVAAAHTGLVVGVDIAFGMVKEAKRVARKAGVSSLVTIQADAHHLPFEDGSFGAVLCSNGLQVMPGLVPSITELIRVLAPGGKLLVSVVNAPLAGVLGPRAREHVPTFLRPRRDVAKVIERAGVPVQARYERLAALFEGTKPA